MNISILGTGNVAQTLAEKFLSLGHEVLLGTRDIATTMARKATDAYGSSSFAEWQEKNNASRLGTFNDAIAFGEIIVNALQGAAVLATLNNIEKQHFDGKILLDVSNPLDFSNGFPPSLIEGLNNTNSLGEEIQKLLPQTKVVKTLNTMYCGIMVNPNSVNSGKHINFICGNDDDAKATVTLLLKEMDWKDDCIMDLGDITNARGTESVLPIWIRVYGSLKTGMFNFNIVKSGI